MPLYGGGRAGTQSTTVTQFGGYERPPNSATGVYPAGQTHTLLQPPNPLRGTTTGDSGSGATTTTVVVVNAPAGVQTGDPIIVAITLRTAVVAPTWRVPAGWTEIGPAPVTGSGSGYFYRAIYGVDVTGTSWTWDAGAGNTVANRWSYACVALDGSLVGPASVLDVNSRSGAATTVDSDTVSVGVDSYLIAFGGSRISTGPSTYSLSGAWQILAQTSQSGTNAAQAMVALIGTEQPPGTYSTTLTDSSSSQAAWIGIAAFTVAANGSADATITGADAQAGGWADPGTASSTGSIPDTPTLLARPDQTAPTGVVTTQYADDTPVTEETFDLRNHEAQGFFFADAVFGYATYNNGSGGTNATAHELNINPYEFGKTTAGTRVAVVGGKSIGDQNRGLSWEDMKHGSPVEDAIDGGMDPATAYATYIPGNNNMDGDGLRLHVATGSWVVVDGFRADNTMDGIGLYSTNDTLADTGDVYVRNCWFNFTHDDTIENDRAYLTLHVDDCLFERVHCAFSYRANDTTGSPDQTKVVTVRNSVIWQYPKPGPFQQPRTVLASGNFYKNQANSPPLVMENVVWAVEKLAASGQADLPTGTGCSYTNVTIVWLGAGAYPGNVPTGCTVTTDPTVITDAVALWKARHGVDSFNTVDMARMIAPLAMTGTAAGTPASAGGQAPAGVVQVDATVTGVTATAAGWAGGGTLTASSTVTGADAEATGSAPAGTAVSGVTVTGTDAWSGGWADAGTVTAASTVTGQDAQAGGSAPAGTVAASSTVTGLDAWAGGWADPGTFTATASLPGADAQAGGWAPAGQALTGTVIQGADAWAGAWAAAGNVQADQTLTGSTANGTGWADPGAVTIGRTIIGADAWSWTDAPAGTVMLTADATISGSSATASGWAPAGSVSTADGGQRDITLHVGLPTRRNLTGTATARSLTGATRTRQLTGTAEEA